MTLIVLMVVCVAIFTVLSLVAMIFLEQEQERVSLGGPQLPPPPSSQKEENNKINDNEKKQTTTPKTAALSTTFNSIADYSKTFKYNDEEVEEC